jgi:hypothetical protein
MLTARMPRQTAPSPSRTIGAARVVLGAVNPRGEAKGPSRTPMSPAATSTWLTLMLSRASST